MKKVLNTKEKEKERSFIEKLIYVMTRPAKESEKKRHKTFLIILFSMYFVILVMSLFQHFEQKEIKEMIVESQDQEEKATYDAIYVGPFGKEHIDVLTQKKHKMFRYKKEVASLLPTLKEGMPIRFEVELNREGEWIIQSLKTLGESVPNGEDGKITKELKQNESYLGYTIELGSEFMLNTYENPLENTESTGESGINGHDKIISKSNPEFYTIIEEIPIESDIQPERWRASSTLKEMGYLEEQKGGERYKGFMTDAEFVFKTGYPDGLRFIWLTEIEGRLFRFETNVPYGENKFKMFDEVNKIQF